MDFKELGSFVAVCEYGNFSKAAEKLYISQPTISMHIKLLEDELNTKLFKRSTKSLVMTKAGSELYNFSVKVLKLKNDFFKIWDKGYDNVIKIGASSIPSAYLLPELISDFKKINSDVEFDIIQGDSSDVLDLLKDSIIEIGLIGMEVNDKKIVCKHFYKDKMVVVTPNNNYFKKLKSSLDDIKNIFKENYILREEGSGTKLAGDKILNDIGVDPQELKIVARVKSQESLINLVESGIGISVVSKKSILNEEKEGKVLAFDLPNNINARNLNVIYYETSVKKKIIKEFINFIKNKYK